MPVPTSPSIGPPLTAWTSINAFDGSGNLLYSGLAKSTQNRFAFTVTSVSKAAAAVVTITAHGLQSDNSVTIAGATGDWAAINGQQIVTVTSANTFTIAVNTSGYAGTFDGSISSDAPRTNATCWAIQKNYYDGSSNLTNSAWADGNPSDSHAWDSRTTYAYK